MKAIIKKITATLLTLTLISAGAGAFASESALLDSRNESQRFRTEAKSLYQYGKFMSDDEAQACFNALQDTEIVEFLHDSMLRRDEEIFISEFGEITTDQLYTYYTAVLNNYPDLYFVSMYYDYYIFDDGTVDSLVPIYTMEEAEVASIQASIDEEVAKACSVIDDGMSDFDKITAVHDYFADNYSYDYKNLRDTEYMRKHNIVSIFIDKTSVCQGYGLGFQYVMQKLGIECITVQSPAMSHLWNLVQLENGNWYHVDVTWDDPSQDWYNPDYTPTMSDEAYEMAIGDVRTYFMLSDNKIKSQDPPHHSYSPDGLALDDTYAETGMLDVNTTVAYCNGKWYYVDSSNNFHAYSTADNSDEILFTTKAGWPYVASFSDVYEYNGKIYYNTATDIMVYDPATGTNSVYISNADGVGNGTCIYDMSVTGNEISYVTAADYLGTSAAEHTAAIKSSSITATTIPNYSGSGNSLTVSAMHTTSGATVVNITGDSVSGTVIAADYADGRLISVKISDAAETVTFDGIAADEVYVWKSKDSMEPLCSPYIIK